MADPYRHAPVAQEDGVLRTRVLGLATVVGFTFLLSSGVSPCKADAVYGANKSKVYHTRADCQSGRKIKPENRVAFQSVKDAESQGRRMCRFCQRLEQKAEKTAQREKARRDANPPGAITPRPSALVGEEVPHVEQTPPEKPEPPSNLPAKGEVRQVMPDGSLELKDGEKVRLLGVCWPKPQLRGSREAVTWLRAHAEHKQIELTYDPGRSQCQHRDAMGRVWAYVQVETQPSDLGSGLLAKGLAWVDRETPCQRNASYDKVEGEAWWHGEGVWKRLEGDAGKRPVVIGRYGRHYYPKDSVWIASLIDPTTITLNEAKSRRLTPPPDTGIMPKKKRSKGRSSAKKKGSTREQGRSG